MKNQAAAEWAGFAAGLVLAVFMWMWGHPQFSWSRDNSYINSASAMSEQKGRLIEQEMDRQTEQSMRSSESEYQTDKPGSVPPDWQGKYGSASLDRQGKYGSILPDQQATYQQGKYGSSQSDWQGKYSNVLSDQQEQHSSAQTVWTEKTGSPRVLSATAQGQDTTQTQTDTQDQALTQAQNLILPRTVSVYLTEEQRIETVPLEIYVRGVVAAEMPSDFHPAALEAQAIAARTYIVRRLLKQDKSDVPVPEADVTDTQTHQVYLPLSEMNRMRSEDEAAWRKYHQAAARTAGRIITYDGEPIQALYFSTSNGYTENSEEVFSHRVPYLRSVDSHWDLEHSPRAKETVIMPLKEFYEKLGVRIIPAIAAIKGYPRLQVKEWTEGKRVKTLALGGKTISGLEVRSKLGLRSASFEWSIQDGEIAITTFGSGHGVGMSQWGAEGMAQAGYTAEEILSHYYPGTELTEAAPRQK